MRIGFFTECYHPIVNGIVASIDDLAGGLRRLGHEVRCFAPRMPGYEESSDVVHRIPSLPLPTQTAYRLTVPMLGRRRRTAIVDPLDVIHAHSPFVTGWMGARQAHRLRVPFVYTYHTRLEEYVHYIPFDPKLTQRVASTLTRRFANLADTVIVPAYAMRDRLIDLGVVAPIEVVPSGIDLAHFAGGVRREELRRSLGTAPGEKLLLFVSRLGREKNVELLLEALARTASPCRLAIAGEGPERPALEEAAHRLGIAGRVRFLGLTDRARLPDLYASADAFVFASLTETQGLVLVEAMAAGAFVIAADAPQLREVLGGAGRLVAATADAFARAFDALPEYPHFEGIARAVACAARYGSDIQAARVAGIYAALRERSKSAAH